MMTESKIIPVPFVWYVYEDISYFRKKEEIRTFHKDIEVLFFVNKESAVKEIEKKLTGDNLIPFSVFAPFFPPAEVEGIFSVVRLPNSYGVLTSQEKEFVDASKNPKQAELQTIENKLRLKVHKPSLNLTMLRGAEKLKEQINFMIKTLDHPLLRLKGVFLVGIPGTGKSYSAKCCAGELNRLLVEVNLSQILQDDRPIDLLFRIFEFVEQLPPSVLWIDEIDKVFTGGEKETKMMGQLLTLLNEFNTETGYKADSFFWVTANSVQQIVMKNPEFFRRFDYLFFVQTPKEKEVSDIFKLYFSKYNVYPDLGEDTLEGNIDRLIRFVKLFYEEFLSAEFPMNSERFIYTPAEIERIVKKLAVMAYSRSSTKDEQKKLYFNMDDLREVIKLNRPVVESMKESINQMIAQKKFFIEV